MPYTLPTNLRNLYETIFNKLRYYELNEPTEEEIIDGMSPFLSGVNDSLVVNLDMTVGKFQDDELEPGITYNSIKTAVEEASENAHITVQAGTYTGEGNINITKSMRITFEPGAVLEGVSGDDNQIGSIDQLHDINLVIDGQGIFKNYKLICFGNTSNDIGESTASYYIEFLDWINTSEVSGFVWWANSTEVRIKCRDIITYGRLLDSDEYAGIFELDFNSAGIYSDFADVNASEIGITLKNGYIYKLEGSDTNYASFQIVASGNIENYITFNNVRMKINTALSIMDTAEYPKGYLVLTMNNCLVEMTEGDRFLEMDESHDTLLIANDTFSNKTGENDEDSTTSNFTANDSTDIITYGAAFNPITGCRVRVSTSVTLPGGLSADTDYWLIRLSNTTGKLATSYDNALSGSAINISSTGTGTHTLTKRKGKFQLLSGNGITVSAGLKVYQYGAIFT